MRGRDWSLVTNESEHLEAPPFPLSLSAVELMGALTRHQMVLCKVQVVEDKYSIIVNCVVISPAG